MTSPEYRVSVDPLFERFHREVDVMDRDPVRQERRKAFDQTDAILPIVHCALGMWALCDDLLALAKNLDRRPVILC